MTRLLAATAVVLLGACSSSSTTSSSSSSAGSARYATSAKPAASAAASGSAAAKPAALTVDAMKAASPKVKVDDPIDSALKTLKSELGPATREGSEIYVWGIPAQSDCSYFFVRESSGKVSEVSTFGTFGRDQVDAFEECYLFLDKPIPDADPNAPGPVADKVYAVSELLDAVNAARSKWVGKTIRVKGKLTQSVKSGPTEDYTLASIVLADEKDEKRTLSVSVTVDVKAAPGSDDKGDLIVAEGKLSDRRRSVEEARVVERTKAKR